MIQSPAIKATEIQIGTSFAISTTNGNLVINDGTTVVSSTEPFSTSTPSNLVVLATIEPSS